jgi:hypothetical protein
MIRSSNAVPLIIEPHPENYTGYKLITMVRYNDENTINIVDNIINKSILAYVLDLCGPAEVDELKFIDIALEWHASGNHKNYPLSVEFSRIGWSSASNKILRVFPVDYVTRIIGPVHEYPMSGYSRCRKRKKRSA